MSLGQLWHESFSYPSLWWDSRLEKVETAHLCLSKKSSRSPDFRHKHTQEVLWFESWSNCPWVEADLAAISQGGAQSEAASKVDADHGASPKEYSRDELGTVFVSPQTCSWHSSFTPTTALDSGLPEGFNKNSSGICRDVWILCKAGRLKEALHILNHQDVRADSNVYVCLLQQCINMKCLPEGKQVHAHIIQSGFKPNIFLLNTLINMYAKCGSVMDARQVFDKMPARNLFTWTIMIAGYARCGCGREAFEIYEQMIWEGQTPDKVTFICVLNACASLGSLQQGKEVHYNIIKAGIMNDIILDTALIDLYAKCGSMKDAHEVFDGMPKRSVVSWSAMITGYAQHGCGMECLKIYEQMQREGVTPNRVTFISVLNACAGIGALEKGKEVHADIIKVGIAPYISLETSLADMYAKCGSLKDARQVFDNMAQRDVVSWNAMISGYARQGCGKEALKMYEQMQLEQVKPNKVTFICILTACATLGALEKGKEIHADTIKTGIVSDTILETTLVDMYAKCGSIKEACQVFVNMAERNVVSWNAMIAGYARCGCGMEAFKTYAQMRQEKVPPDRITFICALNACANLGALEKGRKVHADMIKAGISSNINLENTLVNMYANCGSMKDAHQVFDYMFERDVVSWNSMIAGCAQHGSGREALQLFEQMQHEGISPDSITFTSLLSACSRVGLVDEGSHYFDSMSQAHGLTPTGEHFGCMVDLLGRSGQLDEAKEFINKMPIEPGALVWRALLGSCRIHGKVEQAQCVAENIIMKDPEHAAAYVLPSNIYAAAGRWDDQAKMTRLMEDRCVKKEPGRNSIDVYDQVHTFVLEDQPHPQIQEIHAQLRRFE